jgi:cytochrome c-type biogenesis protein CcmH
MLVLLPCLIVGVGLGYFYWGGYDKWSAYVHQQALVEQARKVLSTVKSPQEVIDRLKEQLKQKPDSAQGWYLLGRLYTNQKDYQEASEAFAKAYQQAADNAQFALQYVYSIWSDSAKRAEARAILQHVLKIDKNQADALALLAQDAFAQQQYSKAISYWQRLLRMLPPGSKEALAVRAAIAKAQSAMR